MQRSAVTSLALLLACSAGAQSSRTVSLVLQVNPEARLDPQWVALSFVVAGDGGSDGASQTASVAASVRALPGQRIRVTAVLASLTGPDGPVPVSVLDWSGSANGATAGARAATCSSGTFKPGAIHDLVLGWQRSGAIACTVTFKLSAPETLAPGRYSGTVDLAVDAQ